MGAASSGETFRIDARCTFSASGRETAARGSETSLWGGGLATFEEFKDDARIYHYLDLELLVFWHDSLPF